MGNLEKIKREVNLVEYSKAHYGYKCDSKGRGSCLLHPPDNHHSFSIWKGEDDIWRFKCFHADVSGTIVDLVSIMEGISEKEACQKLLKKFDSERFLANKLEIEREHIYKGLNGNPVHKKIKFKPNSFGKTWVFKHFGKDGKWHQGKGNNELIPYNLDKFKDYKIAIVCEGEKDADNVNALGLDLIATSAPVGKGAWPDSITKYFKSFKKISFIYDVGAVEDAKKHANKLKNTFPALNIFITEIPLEEEGADVTDWLDLQVNKKLNFSTELLSPKYSRKLETIRDDEDVAETVEELVIKEIPPIERLINPLVERRGYTLIGAIKGVGKSLFVTQLALHYASGKSPFLVEDFTIEKPGNVLLIQQEVSLPGIKDRLQKMRMEAVFNLQGRFRQKTTTGHPWALTKKEDFEKLVRLIEKYKPDILILDPLYTFAPNGLNTDKDTAPIIKAISDLKTNYNLGIIVVHHFSNKGRDEDMIATVGKFMGASMIANNADITIAMEFLHPRFKEQNLPLPYNHYCTVEVGTRHGEWPQKFCIERKKGCLLFHKSSIWQEIGRIIMPGQIEDLLAANDGEMLQKDVIEALSREATRTTIRRAIDEAINNGTITKHDLPGKGKPKILRLVNV